MDDRNWNDSEIVERVIRDRKTTKVLRDVSVTGVNPARINDEFRNNIRRSIATAAWAPFHFRRDVDGVPEPWRVHLL